MLAPVQQPVYICLFSACYHGACLVCIGRSALALCGAATTLLPCGVYFLSSLCVPGLVGSVHRAERIEVFYDPLPSNMRLVDLT